MKCMSSVSNGVKINDKPCGEIRSLRGLRQGDPLFPYLFIICTEGMSALIHSSVQRQRLRGVAASSGGPSVSHLFFADDSLIFGRASLEECAKIQRVLQIYEQSSGQKLNRSKTSLFFSPNTADELMESIKAMFGANEIRPHESYLGLPSLVGRSKSNTFTNLK